MKTKSFTLIELLVVIVIIGILAAVIIVSTSSSISKANIAKVKVFENSIQNELGANMVSRWKLDEIVGTITTPDAWGSNTGTLTNGPVLKSEAECVTGKCMYFDGTNDFIDCGNNSNLLIANSMTINAWIKPINTTLHHQILANGFVHTKEGVRIGYINNVFSGYWQDVLNGIQYIVSDSNPTLNQWSHVVFVLGEKGKVEMYINGKVQADVKNFNGILRLTAVKTYIGASSDQRFNGLIDDVRIYNAALSTSQIKQEYIAGLNSLLANNSISKEEYDQRLNNLAQK